MDPTQLYETVIVNRDHSDRLAEGAGLRIVTIPARSLVAGEVPPVERLAEELRFGESLRLAPVEGWSIPFLIDAIIGRFPDGFPWMLEVPFTGGRRRGEGPSRFAQHIAYEPVIPFESSPLKGSSLAELLTRGGAAAGGAVGIVEGNVLVVLAVPAGIILVGAARGGRGCTAYRHQGEDARLDGSTRPSNDPPGEDDPPTPPSHPPGV